jgi:hypothetical protein
MYRPEILDIFDILGPFSLGGPLQNHGHKMAAGATVFCDTLISVVPAGVRVTSATLHCRWWRNHPRQSYIHDSSRSSPYIIADDRVIRHSVLSLILVGVRVTSWILHSTRRRARLPQRYIPHSSSFFCGLQEITSLQTTVVHSYSKCVALSVMRTICFSTYFMGSRCQFLRSRWLPAPHCPATALYL